VKVVVKKNGYALEYASDKLKHDREIVLEAVKSRGHALEYASEELKNDKKIVQTAICSWESENNYFLSLDDKFSFDKSGYIDYLKTQDRFVEFISELLLNDKEIIEALVNANGWLIEKLPQKWSSDLIIKTKSEESKKKFIKLSK